MVLRASYSRVMPWAPRLSSSLLGTWTLYLLCQGAQATCCYVSLAGSKLGVGGQQYWGEAGPDQAWSTGQIWQKYAIILSTRSRPVPMGYLSHPPASTDPSTWLATSLSPSWKDFLVALCISLQTLLLAQSFRSHTSSCANSKTTQQDGCEGWIVNTWKRTSHSNKPWYQC